eukprot:14276-Heterococcus_DN1.PRE.2
MKAYTACVYNKWQHLQLARKLHIQDALKGAAKRASFLSLHSQHHTVSACRMCIRLRGLHKFASSQELLHYFKQKHYTTASI